MNRRDRSTRAKPAGSPRHAFTLVELMVVMVIIGIVIALILRAAMGGIRTANERATQGLIAKLDTGITDRLEALLTERTIPTQAHQDLAAIFNSSIGTALTSAQRAQVIANIDHLKAELPDVFYIATSGDKDYNSSYPINFSGAAFPNPGPGTITSYLLPYDYPTTRTQTTGYFGASVTVRAALQKNINPGGNNPIGTQAYDMVDNNGDGLVDDTAEGNWGSIALDATGKQNAGGQTIFQTFQGLHKHKTARAEVLYAILVEGQGPLGSAFSPDDFTSKEVQDTDGDGLPEFVDAWGEPLQFYRWPLFFHSDIQKGFVPPLQGSTTPIPPYASVFEPREQNPLDPNQLLMVPSWWSSFNSGPFGATSSGSYGGGVAAFQLLFHTLVEPYAATGSLSNQYFWDRSGNPRRAFYSKFLIASSGADTELGIARIDVVQQNPTPGITVPLLQLESQARQTDLNATSQTNALYFYPDNPNWTNPSTSNTFAQAGLDDVTNHNYQAPGGVVQ